MDWLLKAALGFMVVIAALIFTALGVLLYQEATCERIEKEVPEIGGCSRYGCGVRYGDGTFGEESSPVIGQMVRVCK
jgi:hypothetical protein